MTLHRSTDSEPACIMLSSAHCLSSAKQQLCSVRKPAIAPSATIHRLTSHTTCHHMAWHPTRPPAGAKSFGSSSSSSRRQAIVAAAAVKKQKASSGGGKGFGNPDKIASGSADKAKQKCPCGSKQLYSACCGRYHAGALAPTPEALLRARFSAYAMQHVDYLVATTHKQNPEYTGDSKSYTRSVKQTAQGTEYLALKILDLPEEYVGRTQQASVAAAEGSNASSSSSEEDGYLKFSVRWRPRVAGGTEQLAVEVSHFKKVDGAWLYYAECE